MRNKGLLKVLNGIKLILDNHENNLDSLRISLEFFRSFRGSLLHKPVTGHELFFAASYSKLSIDKKIMSIKQETLRETGLSVDLVEVQ